MTNPSSIAQTLERARGLLSDLVDQDKAPGSTQLQNMLIHVSNIQARVVGAGEDPTNAVKRLRDFSLVIKRYKPDDQELAMLLRSAADQLMAGVQRPAAA